MERKTGIVKWFNRMRGYGFIVPAGGGPDVFAHYEHVEGEGYRNLYEGDEVTFDEVDVGKGPQAQNIQRRRGV